MPKKKKNNQKKKPVLTRLQIYCEGENTEPNYIEGFQKHYYSEKRTVVVVRKTTKNTPMSLVNEAILAKKGFLDDTFWVVYDRESIKKHSHKEHLEAQTLADKNNIKIAISSICFEYWILLHFYYTTATKHDCDAVWKNKTFKTYLPDYSKKIKKQTDLFDKLQPKIYQAITHAEQIRNEALKSAQAGKEHPSYFNAYTDVHELLIDIKLFCDKDHKAYKEKDIKKLNPKAREELIQEMIVFFKPKDTHTKPIGE